MSLATFSSPNRTSPPQPGACLGDSILNLQAAQRWVAVQHKPLGEVLPDSLYELIAAGPQAWRTVQDVIATLKDEDRAEFQGTQKETLTFPLEQVSLHPPLPRPMSLRDFLPVAVLVLTSA